jgi:CheY-like chemotaxis protein
MPKEMLSRIFDPFYTTKSEGHGLGLTTCHSIIRRHDGDIEVASEPGKGSTFHLHLPAIPDAFVTTDTVATKKHSGTGIVIVLDDDKLVLATMARILGSFGYVVVCTPNGDEALNALKTHLAAQRSIAFLIVDLTVRGGRGGREIISEVRSLCPELPVFVVSGYGEDPVISRPTDFGFTASLSKPFTKADLAQLLEMHRL